MFYIYFSFIFKDDFLKKTMYFSNIGFSEVETILLVLNYLVNDLNGRHETEHKEESRWPRKRTKANLALIVLSMPLLSLLNEENHYS